MILPSIIVGLVSGCIIGAVLCLIGQNADEKRELRESLCRANRDIAFWKELYADIRKECETAETKLELHESSAIIEAAFQSIEGE